MEMALPACLPPSNSPSVTPELNPPPPALSAATALPGTARRGALAAAAAVLLGGGRPDPSLARGGAWAGPAGDRDGGAEPVGLYGALRRKLIIEMKEGNRVVGRRSGCTVEACLVSIPRSEELSDRELTVAGIMEKPFLYQAKAAYPLACVTVEDESRAKACPAACERVCAAELARYDVRQSGYGFPMTAAQKDQAYRGCDRECNRRCDRPGMVDAFFYIQPR